MITSSPPRRSAALLTALAVAASSLLVPTAALAAEGPAPESREFRVLGGVHADTVSTFLDDGRLALGSKADVEEGNGTRFAADDVWFHLEDASQLTIPGAAYEFIAPAGSTVWIAPESNPGPGKLWPGFNTESVALGAIDGNRSTFTLTSVEGPGELEVFTGGGFGAPNRLWSSQDDAFRTITLGRTHMHANWAFTAAGTYRLGVEGSVVVNGVTQTASATYTFVVGDLPPQVETRTSLTASAAQAVTGDDITLSASVMPSGVPGHIEFRNGATVLGHEDVADGAASFVASGLSVGEHQLTAVFVPSVVNTALSSTSAPTTVTMTDASGQRFGIRGVQAGYSPGDALSVRVVGASLGENQMYRWMWRPVGETFTGTTLQTSTSTTLERVLDASVAGYELSVTVRDCTNASCSSGTVVAQSPWVSIDVAQGERPVLTRTVGDEAFYPGDTYRMEASHLHLGDGESARFAFRSLGLSATWRTSTGVSGTDFSSPAVGVVEGRRTGTNIPATALGVAVQVVKDGVVVRQSEPLSLRYANFELPMTGLQTLYAEGATAELQATIYPVRATDRFTYQWQFSKNADFSDTVLWGEGTAVPAAVNQVVTVADHNDGYLRVAVLSESGERLFTSDTKRVHVTNDPNAQLFILEPLQEHYHQGDTVDLRLTVSPEPLAGDTVTWQWRWPGSEVWVPVPGASGQRHQLTAEQALNGVEVRAVLDFAASGREDQATDPVTIHVDDHGAAPRQKVAVTGVAEHYRSGDSVKLQAQVSPASVLTRWEWYVQKASETTPALVHGANTSELEFRAGAEFDGAAVFARLTFADSTPYVESPPVTIHVDDHGHEPSPEPTDPGVEPSPQPTDPGVEPSPQPTDPGVEPSPDPTDPGLEPSPEPTDPGQVSPQKPTVAPTVRTGDELSGVPAGGVSLAPLVRQGQVVTLALGDAHADEWVAAWLFSEPVLLGGDWAQTSADGTIAVRIPESAPAGAHRVAVFAADGDLIGWADVSVTAAPAATPVVSLPATGGEISPAWLIGGGGFLVVGALALLISTRRREG